MPIVADLFVVLVFAAVGRASHGLDAGGVLVTAWPFLVGCAVAWAVLLVLGDQGRGLRGAAVVWLITLLGGVALRITTGETAQPSFVLVSAIFLGACFGGWRLASRLILTRGGA